MTGSYGPHLSRDGANGYVARIRKDGLRLIRAELDRISVLKAERREAEERKRRQLARELKQIARQGL